VCVWVWVWVCVCVRFCVRVRVCVRVYVHVQVAAECVLVLPPDSWVAVTAGAYFSALLSPCSRQEEDRTGQSWPYAQLTPLPPPFPAHAQVLIVEDGTIRNYPGDFEDYRNMLIKEIETELDQD